MEPSRTQAMASVGLGSDLRPGTAPVPPTKPTPQEFRGPTGARGLLRRFAAHLTRTRARAAWSISAVAVGLYVMAPYLHLGQSLIDPIRQFSLVLASVSASALFLPELSAELWRMSSGQIRRLVPDDRRRSLSRALIEAECSESEWGALVYEQALEPLLQAGRHPALVVKNMNYAVAIHLNRTVEVLEHKTVVHSVETTSNSERVLPEPTADGSYFISVARTASALSTEFRATGCLARELVLLEDVNGDELRPEVWSKAVDLLCRVAVTVNGQVQDVVRAESEEAHPEVVRWLFRPELDDLGQRVPLIVNFDFPLKSTEARIPVIFSGYYCSGATVASMKMYGEHSSHRLSCDAFFARGLTSTSGAVSEPEPDRFCQHIQFSTGRDSILWPGSGVVFSWEPASLTGQESNDLPLVK